MRRLALSLLLLAAVGPAACGRADEASPPPADTIAAADPARGSADVATGRLGPCVPAEGRDSLCFRATRAHDFAGDGRPFTIAVDARGPAPDSLRVALRITRGDTVFHRADWSTATYATYDDAPVGADSTRRRAAAHLARLLADSSFRTASAFLGGASDVDGTLRESIAFDVRVADERRARGLTPADTLPVEAANAPRAVADSARVRALAAELRDAPAFRYFAGGEATYTIAWSRAERRFVVVFACC